MILCQQNQKVVQIFCSAGSNLQGVMRPDSIIRGMSFQPTAIFLSQTIEKYGRKQEVSWTRKKPCSGHGKTFLIEWQQKTAEPPVKHSSWAVWTWLSLSMELDIVLCLATHVCQPQACAVAGRRWFPFATSGLCMFGWGIIARQGCPGWWVSQM